MFSFRSFALLLATFATAVGVLQSNVSGVRIRLISKRVSYDFEDDNTATMNKSGRPFRASDGCSVLAWERQHHDVNVFGGEKTTAVAGIEEYHWQCDAQRAPDLTEPWCPIAWCYGILIEDNPCSFGCTDSCSDPTAWAYRKFKRSLTIAS